MWNVLRTPAFELYHFRRQVPLGPYYADFASHSARLVIEVDGSGHTADGAIAHDARRTAFIETQGYRVLRFTTPQVLDDASGVIETIAAVLHRRG
jgi:very-short-patch-repair endonuclease